MRSLFSLVLLLVAISVQATPVRWTLENVMFDDGGSATGSFVYDADLQRYLSIDITTTSGSGGLGTDYAYSVWDYGGLPRIQSVRFTEADPSTDLSGTLTLAMVFIADEYVLTNAGGTVRVDRGPYEAYCLDSDCDDLDFSMAYRQIVDGGTLSAVPVPAAVWLFGSALAGLGWMRRKQTI